MTSPTPDDDLDDLLRATPVVDDPAQLRTLMDDLHRYLLRRTDPATADDLLADTLLVLWRRRDDLPADTDRSRAFAFGIARTILLASHRNTHRHEALTVDPASPSPDAADQYEIRHDITRALDTLTSDDRELVLLVAWENLTLSAAATVLHITHAAARKRYSRARQKLRLHLLP